MALKNPWWKVVIRIWVMNFNRLEIDKKIVARAKNIWYFFVPTYNIIKLYLYLFYTLYMYIYVLHIHV